MGVADNKTYRDQSPYFTAFKVNREDFPAMKSEETNINSTIKENPYFSNVEIEGKEIVLQPDLSALFRAIGKRHSKGGMDVLLKPDSFVFSDDKDLAFDEKDHEMFELKAGGNFKAANNTPAAVLKRNINPKHYNTMISNISDPYKDTLAKKTSALMLEKYIQTLGNIAYIQEQKKAFPQGLPKFSTGTAPVYSTNLKNEIMQSKQYAKYGGRINPYMAEGGDFGDPECPCGRLPNGDCVPNCPPEAYKKIIPTAKKYKSQSELPTGYKPLYSGTEGSLYGMFTKTVPPQMRPADQKAANEWWTKYLASETPEQKARRKAREATQMKTSESYAFIPTTSQPTGERAECPCGIDWRGDCIPCEQSPESGPEQTATATLTPGTVSTSGTQMKKFPWQFTPWQKMSQAWQWGQFATAKRYMPYRSRYTATYMEPSLINPEQAVGDLRGLTSQQLRGISTLSPVLRNAQMASAVGQMYNQIPGVRSQYDAQNAQIINAARQFNTQTKNQETMQNIGLDQQYYKEAVTGRQNFENMRQYLSNQAMDAVMRDVETNQRLAYMQATQNQPAWGFDYRTGQFYRNPKSILDTYTTAQGDYVQNLLKDIDFKALSSAEKIALIRELQRGKLLQYLPQAFGNTPPPFSQKRGGTYNPYEY